MELPHLHHEPKEITKEEALESARKAAKDARHDREKLEKWEAGHQDNPAYGISPTAIAAVVTGEV